MKKQLIIWKFIRKSLGQKIPVMLLYVLESSGSSPGRQGFFMAVNGDDEMEGSIGGGIMEHKFVELAKEKMHEFANKKYEVRKTEIKKQVHDKAAAKNQSGMICSGEQTIVLFFIQQKDVKQIDKIISSMEENKNGLLQISSQEIIFKNTRSKKDFEFIFKNENDWLYKEKTGYKNNLFIVGGGHCALAFSKLMSEMDFYIYLFEERKNLNTVEANKYVHEKKIIDDYGDLEDLIPSGKNNYVVIMTFGYRTDDKAVKALLQKYLKYFGLLGSKKKIEKMFQDYRKEGIEEEKLKKIYSPIGLQIKSETPEEIAVSIAAEIIKVKNKK